MTMTMTMLEIIQAAAGEMGLSVPIYIAGNTSSDAVQQLALLNSVGRKLQSEYDWQKMMVEYQFNTQYITQNGTTINGSAIVTGIPSTAGLNLTYQVIGAGINTGVYILSVDSATQVTLTEPCTATGTASLNFCKTKYNRPTDWDRPVNRTQWDKTKHWEMMGPETPQEWEWLKSGYIATGPRIRYILLQGYLQIWPPMASNELLSMVYVSKNWVISAGSPQVDKYTMTADTDVTFLPDELMISGLKAAYFRVKGFDATAYEQDFMRLLNIAKAAEAGARTLSFAPSVSNVLITPQNIPDSGFGQPFQ